MPFAGYQGGYTLYHLLLAERNLEVRKAGTQCMKQTPSIPQHQPQRFEHVSLRCFVFQGKSKKNAWSKT